MAADVALAASSEAGPVASSDAAPRTSSNGCTAVEAPQDLFDLLGAIKGMSISVACFATPSLGGCDTW